MDGKVGYMEFHHVLDLIIKPLCARCGPMTRYWCMRFEGKHNYFKDLAQRTKCFKNIAKSLSHRHQRLVCYHLAKAQSLVKEMETGKGEYCTSLLFLI